jgi:GTP-binding protein
MRILDANYIKSSPRKADWPAAAGRPEIAFCGRSNVGKSSLLNALLGRGSLARVSQTPGRTRLINFFSARYSGSGGSRGELLCADLPGFGYAEVSRNERQQWQGMIEEYFTGRDALSAVVLLFDARRLQGGDERASDLLFDELELANYLQSLGRPIVPVVTKSDKLSKNERKPAAMVLSRLLRIDPVILSSQSGEGMDDLWKRILRILQPKPAAPRSPSPSDPGRDTALPHDPSAP